MYCSSMRALPIATPATQFNARADCNQWLFTFPATQVVKNAGDANVLCANVYVLCANVL